MKTQIEKARIFRELHEREGTFIIPNPWDVGSARLLNQLGFQALATTSGGFAFSQGKPDGQVGRDAMLQHVGELVAAVDLPVSGDLENCYGDAPEVVAETVRLAAEVGLVGCSVEDATGDADRPIYEANLAVDRVKAAAEAAHSLAIPFMLTARCENFLHGRRDMEDTIQRLQAYQDAGADVLYAPGLSSLDQVEAVLRAVKRPINVLATPNFDVANLARLGVRRISVGSALARAAYTAFLKGSREMLEHGTFTYAREAVSTREWDAMFGKR